MPDPLEALRLPVVPVEPRPEFAAALLRRIEGIEESQTGGPATVRYYVSDLNGAVAFYRDLLGFEEELRPSPAFAMLYRGDLRLLLSVGGGAGDGAPLIAPRIVLRVGDLDAVVGDLRGRGVRFRTGITAGVTVRQALLHDPAGNLVELFEPGQSYHERGSNP